MVESSHDPRGYDRKPGPQSGPLDEAPEITFEQPEMLRPDEIQMLPSDEAPEWTEADNE